MSLPTRPVEHRHAIARRLCALVRYMDGRRYMPDMAILARGLNVSHRTLYRDLAALEEAGFILPRRINDAQEAA